MGGSVGKPAPNANQIMDFLNAWVLRKTSDKITISTEYQSELCLKYSSLFDPFNPKGNQGIFTNKFIPKGTYLCTANLNKFDPIDKKCTILTLLRDDNLSRKVNDGNFDWNDLKTINANTFDELKAKYYTQNENINVVFVLNESTKTVYLCTVKDIQPGQELLRAYGLTVWYGDIANYLINKPRELALYKEWLINQLHVSIPPEQATINSLLKFLN